MTIRAGRRPRAAEKLRRVAVRFGAAEKIRCSWPPMTGSIQHADADDGGPIGQLVPGEQASGKVGRQYEDQKAEFDNPFSRRGG